MNKVLVLVLLSSAVFAKDKKKPELPGYSCMPAANEQCPPREWFDDFQRLKALAEKYRAPQEVVDQMNGMSSRLRQQVPQGYHVDEGRVVWVKDSERAKPVEPKTEPEKAVPEVKK